MSQLRGVLVRVLLAVGLSFTLWMYVTFTENPDQTASFEDVTVRIQGKTPGLLLVDERGLPLDSETLPTRLDQVVLQADAQALSGLTRSDIDVYIDLTGLGPGDYSRPVLTQSRRSDLRLRFLETNPDYMSVRLEALITATVPLSLSVQGLVPFVYERGEPQLTGTSTGLDTVQVSGPAGLVQQVEEVRAIANVSGLTASFEASLPLTAIDDAGQQVQGVQVTPSEISVEVPIRPSVGLKSVAITAPPVVGTPAPGFQVTAIRVSPPFVNVTGSSEALADVRSITTQPIDITDANASLTRELALQVPEGIALLQDSLRRVLVTVEIEAIDRPLSFSAPVPVDVVNLGGDVLLRTASPATLLLTLNSSAGNASSLDLRGARAVVDVGGLGPGTYQLRPVIELPPGVQVAGDVPQVTVTLVAPTQPPRPLPTASPDEPTDETTDAPGSSPTAPPATAPTPTAPVPDATDATPTATSGEAATAEPTNAAEATPVELPTTQTP
jgi:YbbR domain-containing protein